MESPITLTIYAFPVLVVADGLAVIPSWPSPSVTIRHEVPSCYSPSGTIFYYVWSRDGMSKTHARIILECLASCHTPKARTSRARQGDVGWVLPFAAGADRAATGLFAIMGADRIDEALLKHPLAIHVPLDWSGSCGKLGATGAAINLASKDHGVIVLGAHLVSPRQSCHTLRIGHARKMSREFE